MRFTRMSVFAIIVTPLLGACAGTSAYLARAEAARQNCSPLEGNPDCVGGQRVEPIVYEPGVDRTSIQELLARYEAAVGAGDPSALAALFTEDAVLESPAGTVRGRDAIGGELAQPGAIATLKVSHVVTNAVIHLDGLNAASTASWFELDRGPQAGHAQLGSYGHYEDSFIKKGRTWMFVKRKIVTS